MCIIENSEVKNFAIMETKITLNILTMVEYMSQIELFYHTLNGLRVAPLQNI